MKYFLVCLFCVIALSLAESEPEEMPGREKRGYGYSMYIPKDECKQVSGCKWSVHKFKHRGKKMTAAGCECDFPKEKCNKFVHTQLLEADYKSKCEWKSFKPNSCWCWVYFMEGQIPGK